MRVIERVNYFHYGNQLDLLEKYYATTPLGQIPVYRRSGFGKSRLTITQFEESRRYRQRFRSLKVRGFSYCFGLDIGGFGVRFERSVNLRAALCFDKALFYPKKVRLKMRRVVCYHCGSDRLPPIAFALGRKIGDRWYVLQIQSDIAYKSGAIGNHFRGWSRVLLDCLNRRAIKSGARLFVCPSAQVLRAVEPDYLRPESVPDCWRTFYDRSASAIGMKSCVLKEFVNLQVHPGLKPILCNEFLSFP